MHLTFDAVTVRFFAPWKTSCRLNHDVSHAGLTAIAKAIETLAFVDAAEIGAGHSGIYFDVRMACKPHAIAPCVSRILDLAKTLTP